MKRYEYILSYLYPQVIETTSSQWNSILEVVLFKGKFMLNSENTNYSHGTLYSLFQKIFKKLELDWQKTGDVLILGYGTGSIAEIIRKYNGECSIDGVEIDKKVIELGEKYFQIEKMKNTTIHVTGAKEYVETCRRKYDIILIDVFIDMYVPAELETEEFIRQVKNILKENGMVIFNKVTYTKKIQDQIPVIKDKYVRIFGNLKVLTVMNTGKIFIAKNTKHILNFSILL